MTRVRAWVVARVDGGACGWSLSRIVMGDLSVAKDFPPPPANNKSKEFSLHSTHQMH